MTKNQALTLKPGSKILVIGQRRVRKGQIETVLQYHPKANQGQGVISTEVGYWYDIDEVKLVKR